MITKQELMFRIIDLEMQVLELDERINKLEKRLNETTKTNQGIRGFIRNPFRRSNYKYAKRKEIAEWQNSRRLQMGGIMRLKNKKTSECKEVEGGEE